MKIATRRGTIDAEEFGALCNLFDAIHCCQIDPSAAQAGDILYFGANRTVCDHSRMIARVVLAYLGIRTGVPEADELISEIHAAMRNGEGTLGEPDPGPPSPVLYELIGQIDDPAGMRNILRGPDGTVGVFAPYKS
jgi:hypothetical protein